MIKIAKPAKNIIICLPYFLYKLTESQLKDIILPLGKYTKEEIREIAEANGLEVAQKPDSQDFFERRYYVWYSFSSIGIFYPILFL